MTQEAICHRISEPQYPKTWNGRTNRLSVRRQNTRGTFRQPVPCLDSDTSQTRSLRQCEFSQQVSGGHLTIYNVVLDVITIKELKAVVIFCIQESGILDLPKMSRIVSKRSSPDFLFAPSIFNSSYVSVSVIKNNDPKQFVAERGYFSLQLLSYKIM